ncbi:MAG: EAL domain-containing protein [Trichlorobacter sp.]|jgi:diguanylate cyclase (GGDEF)-like protein
MPTPHKRIGTILVPTLLGAALLLAIAMLQYHFVLHIPPTPRNFVTPALVGSIAGFFIGLYHRRLRSRETHLQEAYNDIWHSAYYDQLTGLPNRTLLLDRLRQAVAHAQRQGETLGVMLLDIDRFKRINETLGHTLGDQLLLVAAERIASCLSQSDTVARLGGDEFVMLMPDLKHPDDAAQMASRILESIALPAELGEHEVFCSGSIGIILAPLDGDDAETILKHADIAMYKAKDAGGNCCRFYSWYMNQQTMERLAMEANMQRGLERGDFFLHYQPQIDLHSGRVVGVEALLRWDAPGIGLISPVLFIPLAEETGFILPLGEWALRTACQQAVLWQRRREPPIRVAVNLSIRQFRQKNLVETVAAILAETGLNPHLLELELTESCFVDQPDEAMAVLHELSRVGVKLSIDDFGTGYSSLAYLKLCPINHLKIAIHFVRDITSNPDDAAIAEAIIAMAHALGISVIAEGIETPEQRLFLELKGCDLAQGFLLARPMPPENVTRLLAMDEPARNQFMRSLNPQLALF